MKLLTTEELSERWSIHPGTLKNWRSKKRGPPFIKCGDDAVRYRIEDILAFEKKNRYK